MLGRSDENISSRLFAGRDISLAIRDIPAFGSPPAVDPAQTLAGGRCRAPVRRVDRPVLKTAQVIA
jgi:hypothetical protein